MSALCEELSWPLAAAVGAAEARQRRPISIAVRALVDRLWDERESLRVQLGVTCRHDARLAQRNFDVVDELLS